jgi:hypothetical protein
MIATALGFTVLKKGENFRRDRRQRKVNGNNDPRK